MEQEPALCQGIILSDTVIREMGTGKLSIIGSFSRYNVPSFPFPVPPFIVTVLLTNLQGPLEQFPVAIRVENRRSGHVLASASGDIAASKELTKTEVIEVPIQLPPIIFTEPGVYKITALAENSPLGDRDLSVNSLSLA
jgi:uncharacterized protein DUF6941